MTAGIKSCRDKEEATPRGKSKVNIFRLDYKHTPLSKALEVEEGCNGNSGHQRGGEDIVLESKGVQQRQVR